MTGIIGSSDEPYNHIDEEQYGLGKVRSKETFFRTFGIHLENRTVENHLCWFAGQNMQQVFLPIGLRKNRMGIDYSLIDYQFVDPAPDQQ